MSRERRLVERGADRGGDVIVAMEGVSRTYRQGRVTAVRDVTIAVARGEYLAVVGPSGGGKSTLLHLMCGIESPTGGRILFEGSEPSSPAAWAALRARRIGLVFQAFNLLPTLTAAENVEAPLIGVWRRERDRRARAMHLLERVGLLARAAHLPSELSGGECQRVAVARALANGPSLILADEPTGNLDTVNSRNIMEILREIHAADGVSVLLATHEPNHAANAGRILHLVDGRIESGIDGPRVPPCAS